MHASLREDAGEEPVVSPLLVNLSGGCYVLVGGDGRAGR